MKSRAWFRPPYQVLSVFISVAVVSAAAVMWLGWQLFEQEKALELQRHQERLEQAADRASATLQRTLADLHSYLRAPALQPSSLPAGVVVVWLERNDVIVRPSAELLYYPVTPSEDAAPSGLFTAGELLEYGRRDPRGAAAVFARFTASDQSAIRAAALMRLARVRRKLRDASAALHAYDELARVDARVEGLPASLIGHVGRASVFEETGQVAQLRSEATILGEGLRTGRWRLTGSEYRFYAALARTWGSTAEPPSADATVLAEAVEWVWRQRAALDPDARHIPALKSGPALIIAAPPADANRAVVAGPSYLRAMCSSALPAGVSWALTDDHGRHLLGDSPPRRQVAVRTSAASGLPATLHVFAAAPHAWTASPRFRLLLLVFAVMAVVLSAGCYFIVSAISRELRLARLQSDFVSAVSHEFRSPLTSLSHIAQMLASSRFPSEESRRTAYDVLVRDTERLRRLVEGLLDLGKLEAGAAVFRFERVAVGELVTRVVAEFGEAAAKDGYSVEFTQPAAEIHVRADPDALARALRNLLENAVKYSPVCRTVWVDVAQKGDRVSVAVQDQGLGIPAGEQRAIFKRFVRGTDTRERRIAGSGIGLAIVTQIVKAHGGDIHVTSEPGRGSRFTLVLHAAGGPA